MPLRGSGWPGAWASPGAGESGEAVVTAFSAAGLVSAGGSAGVPRCVGRRARQRGGVEVYDLVDALGELPAVWGALVAVVVHGVIQVRAAVAHVPETQDVGTAGRGVAVKLDRARVRGLHEVVPQILLQPLDPGADLFPAGELGADGGDPPHGVVREQRREAVVIVHHPRVGELAAQRLDLDAVSDGLKIAHRFPCLSSVLCLCLCITASAELMCLTSFSARRLPR